MYCHVLLPLVEFYIIIIHFKSEWKIFSLKYEISKDSCENSPWKLIKNNAVNSQIKNQMWCNAEDGNLIVLKQTFSSYSFGMVK